MLPGMASIGGFSVAATGGMWSYSEGRSEGLATVSVTKPVGTVAGDTLVAITSDLYGSTWTGDSGFTERYDSGANAGLRIATLVAGGSEPSSYTFTSSTDLFTQCIVAQVICFRGLQYDVVGTNYALATDGAAVMPGVTAAGGLLLAIVATRYAVDASTNVAHSTPGGMSVIKRTAGNDTGDLGPVLTTFQQVISAGATGNKTSNITLDTDLNDSILIALKP